MGVRFDRIASSYRFLETIAFGNALQRARTAFIPETGVDMRVLVAGEGDGRFLAEFVQRNPAAKIDCVDASAAMIQRARGRAVVIPRNAKGLPRLHTRFGRANKGCATDDASLKIAELSRVKFHNADIFDWAAPASRYDLIVTHFFLDCFSREQIPIVIEKLAQLTAPRARWLISDFSVPSRTFRKVHAELWLHAMYTFFAVAAGLKVRELVDPSPFLRAAGFEIRNETAARFGLIKSQLWERPH